MTRAYLRLDPEFVDHKAGYPDGAFRAYVETLCLAEQQPHRGRFRSDRLLRVLLEGRARWVRYLLEHGDLVQEASGSLYVEGWDEWQEGDWKVYERVSRIRNRRPLPDTNGNVGDDTNGNVGDDTAGNVRAREARGGGGGGGGGIQAEAGRRNHDAPSDRPLTEDQRVAELGRLRGMLSHPHPGVVRSAEKAIAALQTGEATDATNR